MRKRTAAGADAAGRGYRGPVSLIKKEHHESAARITVAIWLRGALATFPVQLSSAQLSLARGCCQGFGHADHCS